MKWPESFQRTRPGKVGASSAAVFTKLISLIGGSLGWKARGSLNGDFEKVAYDLEPSTTSSPKYKEVKTGFGYHIIMVEGRK
jgi:peptidyl-prolyl cis-trans isomerase NIMA-interacting 4